MPLPAEYVEAVLAGATPKELRERFNLPERRERKWRARVRRNHNVAAQDISMDTDNAGEVWQKMVELQAALAQQARAQSEVDITIESDRPVGVAFPSDWHIGNVGTDHELLREHVDIMADTEGLYAVVGPDAVDNFIIDKLASAARNDMLGPMAQYQMVRWLLERMQDKILVVAEGNHDGWTEKLAGIPYLGEIARGLKKVYTGQSGVINLTVGNVTYVIYRQHKGRYNSSFNLTHTVKQAYRLGQWPFDIGVGEHDHVPTFEPFWAHGEKKVAIRTGTYKTRDKWAMDNGFWGARIGVPVVILWPDRKKVSVPDFLDDFRDVVGYLNYVRGG